MSHASSHSSVSVAGYQVSSTLYCGRGQGGFVVRRQGQRENMDLLGPARGWLFAISAGAVALLRGVRAKRVLGPREAGLAVSRSEAGRTGSLCRRRGKQEGEEQGCETHVLDDDLRGRDADIRRRQARSRPQAGKPTESRRAAKKSLWTSVVPSTFPAGHLGSTSDTLAARLISGDFFLFFFCFCFSFFHARFFSRGFLNDYSSARGTAR
mgnify:CR=1 FL=1